MAGTLKLKLPPANFNTLPLTIVAIPPKALCRVSRYDSGEPHYGVSGECRFDDINPDVSARFGTCYLGFDYAVAFAESVLHNEEPKNGAFAIPTSEVADRFLLSFKGRGKLKLANMTGMPLLLLGGNGELSGTPKYARPQAWAAAVVNHPANVDGMIYMSRRVNDRPAVVLFDRPTGRKPVINIDKAIRLYHHPDYNQTIAALNVKARAINLAPVPDASDCAESPIRLRARCRPQRFRCHAVRPPARKPAYCRRLH
jgi:hypothetical protein